MGLPIVVQADCLGRQLPEWADYRKAVACKAIAFHLSVGGPRSEDQKGIFDQAVKTRVKIF
jgi:hypothetical protein